jgi:hypothetical protein
VIVDTMLISAIRETHIFLDWAGIAPGFYRFDDDGTMTLLRVDGGP